jgi:hypothetical protein
LIIVEVLAVWKVVEFSRYGGFIISWLKKMHRK